MSKTQKNAQWARRKRAELIELMGGQCCHEERVRTIGGTRVRRCTKQRRLEFHHTGPRTWVARKTSRWMRIIRYWQDWEDGILVLLCRRHHNQTKGAA